MVILNFDFFYDMMQTACIIRDVFPDVVAEEIIEYFIPRFGSVKTYAKYGVIELSMEYELLKYKWELVGESKNIAISKNDPDMFLRCEGEYYEDLVYIYDADKILPHIKYDNRLIFKFKAIRCIYSIIDTMEWFDKFTLAGCSPNKEIFDMLYTEKEELIYYVCTIAAAMDCGNIFILEMFDITKYPVQITSINETFPDTIKYIVDKYGMEYADNLYHENLYIAHINNDYNGLKSMFSNYTIHDIINSIYDITFVGPDTTIWVLDCIKKMSEKLYGKIISEMYLRVDSFPDINDVSRVVEKHPDVKNDISDKHSNIFKRRIS